MSLEPESSAPPSLQVRMLPLGGAAGSPLRCLGPLPWDLYPRGDAPWVVDSCLTSWPGQEPALFQMEVAAQGTGMQPKN